MGKLLRSLRRAAFQSQHGQCYYCRFPMWEGDRTEFCRLRGVPPAVAAHAQSTAEHLIAQQDGGLDVADNIVAACAWCNRMRHEGRGRCAPSAADYMRVVRERVTAGVWHPLVRYLASVGRLNVPSVKGVVARTSDSSASTLKIVPNAQHVAASSKTSRPRRRDCRQCDRPRNNQAEMRTRESVNASSTARPATTPPRLGQPQSSPAATS